MLFNSFEFVFLLLPISLIVWYALNHFRLFSLSKACLIIFSLVFYAYYNWSYLTIILSSIVVNYLIGYFLGAINNRPGRRALLAVGLLFDLGLLVYYKYFDFFLQNVNSVFGSDFTLRHLVLPLGISFFTFQQISYVIDSYKGETPRYRFLDYALFVSFFPQLVAGPIVLHSEIIPQFNDISKKSFDVDSFCKGLTAFSFGLAKKVLVADALGVIVNDGYASISELSGLQAWMTVLAYTMQIYFDFSGYCDMASGIALMFNIELPINFDSPYKACDILDFWKRWHITLTRFFTKYVYYPLGGDRKSTLRTYFNVFLVFLVSGIWHGAGYTFIIWGLMHGLANIFTRLLSKHVKAIPKAIKWPLNFAFINFTWVIFRSPSLSDAFRLYAKLFSGGTGLNRSLVASLAKCIPHNVLMNLNVPYHSLVYIVALIVTALLLTVFCKNTHERIKNFTPTPRLAAAVIALLSVSVLSLTDVRTFLYFDF